MTASTMVPTPTFPQRCSHHGYHHLCHPSHAYVQGWVGRHISDLNKLTLSGQIIFFQEVTAKAGGLTDSTGSVGVVGEQTFTHVICKARAGLSERVPFR